MLTSNETLEYTDLIRPLSLDALKYFASGEIPVAVDYESPLRCKFIRYGEAMIIGATIDFGKTNSRGKKRSILHADLFEEIRMDEELFNAARSAAEAEPVTTGGSHQGIFNDGGYATIGVDGRTPVTLMLHRDSFDFGRADAAGRQRSLEFAQQLVGDTITVTARD